MANTRVVLNIGGINAVMRSPAIASDLLSRAERIAAAAGEGFVAAQGRPHPWIARAYVYTETRAAKEAEATSRALTRAVGAGR